MVRALLLSCLVFTSAVAMAQQTLPTIELRAGMYRIEAEVARTEKQHEIGLMHRTSMPQQAGMLFVFDKAQEYCFWMKNTLIPLSIAFLDDAGKIVNIADMKPQSEENHCAAKPVRYALEMNLGWFKSKGIKPGASIQGIK